MKEKQWYELLFENASKHYDNEVFTKGTIGECDFIEKEIAYDKSVKILDIGCGTGRHCIELTKRGYDLTGVDLSDSQLTRAKEKAEESGLIIKFQKQDARNLSFRNEFDLVIMLCEGSFPLMETDEMNYDILSSAARSLKSKGKFIFTTLNGLFPLVHSVKEFCNSQNEEGNSSYQSDKFDIMLFRNYNVIETLDDFGNKRFLNCNERYYVPSEITWLLKSLGFVKIDIYGAKLGAYSRNDMLTPDDFEMLIIAER
jgi:SAM-dependent methyltransferase